MACKGNEADLGKGGGVELLGVLCPEVVPNERSRLRSLGGVPLVGRVVLLGAGWEVGFVKGRPV